MADNIAMLDTDRNSQFVPGYAAYAAYVDGHVADQPNFAFILQAFPRARHLSIAVFPAGDADALDVENGAAAPTDIPDWYARQKAAGAERPCLYASVLTMQDGVLPVLASAQIERASVRLWSAHYGDGMHICGPGSCRLADIPMDGTQWTSNALGRALDQSLLLPDFFGPLPPPDGWTYGPPLHLQAVGGHESVRLTWQPPYGAPEPPAQYDVYVYNGTLCDRATLVPAYPRSVSAPEFEGGGLETGRVYTAHVVASGPDGTHVRPWTYADVLFRTG